MRKTATSRNQNISGDKMLNLIPAAFLTTHKNSGKKPRVYFFKGAKGVCSVFLDNLNARGELLSIAGEKTFNDFIIKKYPRYVAERTNRKILLKLIVPDSVRMQTWKKLDPAELRVTKLVTNNLYPLKINIDIYNDRVTMTSFENMIALIIDSKDVADSMRSIFYLLWDNLKESKNLAKIFDTSAIHYRKNTYTSKTSKNTTIRNS